MFSKGMIVITGIICITILEITALSYGHNGLWFTLVIGAIAAAMGVEGTRLVDSFKEIGRDKESHN